MKKSIMMNPTGVQFLQRQSELEGRKITITACWNNKEQWGELCIFTPTGNHSYQWKDTGGDFAEILLKTEEFPKDIAPLIHQMSESVKR